MDLAVELRKLQGKRLLTLDQKKPFQITEVFDDMIVLNTSTDSQRTLPMKEMELAWNHLERHKELTRVEVRDLGYSNFNPAYVVAILANLPGVMHSSRPIILRLKIDEQW
jgi:hypothetical protein